MLDLGAVPENGVNETIGLSADLSLREGPEFDYFHTSG